MKKLIYILLAFSLGMHLLNAQETTIKKEIKSKVSELNGHRFLGASHFKGSFVNTSLQANLGFGMTSLIKIPGIQVGDYKILNFQGQIIFFNMHVEYQQRFTPWLAMYVTFDMNGRVGGDMSTILADGVNTMNGGEIGWLIRLKQSKKVNLSASINVQNLTGNFINVVEYFEEIIDENPYPSVIKKVPAMSIEGGILGAWAINPTFGLQFHGELGYGETFERSETAAYYAAGFSMEADLMPKSNVPLGFALGYSISNAPEIVMDNDGFSNLINAKIAYTGSHDFELGLQYTVYNIHINSVDDDTFINNVLLVLKFYF